jgi:hypothetical protein
LICGVSLDWLTIVVLQYYSKRFDTMPVDGGIRCRFTAGAELTYFCEGVHLPLFLPVLVELPE